MNFFVSLGRVERFQNGRDGSSLCITGPYTFLCGESSQSHILMILAELFFLRNLHHLLALLVGTVVVAVKVNGQSMTSRGAQ